MEIVLDYRLFIFLFSSNVGLENVQFWHALYPCDHIIDLFMTSLWHTKIFVSRFDNCRLAANSPIEDRHAEGYCNATDGFLFGVFDGHGGVANAQAVSERLFNYIAINLLNPNLLAQFCERMALPNEELNLIDFLTHSTTYFNKVCKLVLLLANLWGLYIS